MRIRSQRLPIGYQEVEYIESQNLEYINTGFTADSTSYIEFDFQYTSFIGGYNRFFGARNSNGKGLLNMRTSNSNSGNLYMEAANGSYSGTVADLYRHNIIMDSPNRLYKIDGVTKTSNFYINDNTEGTMWIFGTNNGGSTSAVRFFSYKHIKNGQLIQKLVPCYRISDGVGGMYDLVNNNFLTTASGTFLKGNKVNDSKRIRLSLLPSAYQEVEYISQERYNNLNSGTTGLAYIQSNLSFSQIDQIKLDITVLESVSRGKNICLCAYENGQYIIADYTQVSTVSLGTNTFIPDTSTLFSDGKRHTLTISGITSNNTVGIRTAWDWYWWDKTLFHDIKFFKNGVLIQHLIPCYRKSDNVIGMYDMVGKQFFTNVGQGSFIKGNDLSSFSIEGGASDIYYKFNQLFVPTTSTANWVSNASTLVFNEDGSITITLTNAGVLYGGAQMVSTKATAYFTNHKYYWACDVYADTHAGNGAGFGLNLYSSGGGYAIQENQAIPEKTWYRDEKIYTPTRACSGTIYPWIFGNQRDDRSVGDAITVKNVMFIDLTDIFGVGEEPTTITELKQKLVNNYYGYWKEDSFFTLYQINALPQYGYNQLIEVKRRVQSGVTWNVFDANTYLLSGATSNTYSSWSEALVGGHKYYIEMDILENPNNVELYLGLLNCSVRTPGYTILGKTAAIGTYPTGSGKSYGIVGKTSNNDLTGIKLRCMLIDLTYWYGAGNEPTTVVAFETTFNKKYYKYATKNMLNEFMIKELGVN